MQLTPDEEQVILLRTRNLLYAHRKRTNQNHSSFNAHALLALLKKQNFICAICKVRRIYASRQLDHIEPIRRRGTNHINNVQWTCPRCNYQKQCPYSQPANLTFRFKYILRDDPSLPVKW